MDEINQNANRGDRDKKESSCFMTVPKARLSETIWEGIIERNQRFSCAILTLCSIILPLRSPVIFSLHLVSLVFIENES